MGLHTRKVAKNALYLYMRTAVSLVVQFIAIRYLLKNLGVDGYGLYGLIGSIVGLVESLKGLLSSSIQRFINIEIGNHSEYNIKDIFNVGLRIHAILAIGLIAIIIITGLIFIPHLNIPPSYLTQSYYVLIISSLTMGVGIVCTPFDALITSYERFNLYAINSIITSILKLIIALSLAFFPLYTVTIYALLLLVVISISNFINIYYCYTHFRKYILLRKVENRSYYKALTTFAGLKSLGTISITIQNSGLNFILNIFGGLIVNTARTITYQLLTAVNTLTWNINIGFTPRCLILWGAGEYKEFYNLISLETKFCFSINSLLGCLIATFSIPLLNLWLGYIPEYTSVFIRIIFIYAVLKSMQDIFDLLFSAQAKIKLYQISVFIINILSVVCMYLTLYIGLPLYSVFWTLVLSQLFVVLTCIFLVRIQLNFNLGLFFKDVLSRIMIAAFIQVGLFYIVNKYVSGISNFFTLLLYALPFFIILSSVTLFTVFKKKELKSLISLVRK